MRIIPAFFKSPDPPSDIKMVAGWIRGSLMTVLSNIYRTLGDRSEDMIQEGTIGQMPIAQGRRRFYYATDTDDLYYDVGSWKKVGHGT